MALLKTCHFRQLLIEDRLVFVKQCLDENYLQYPEHLKEKLGLHLSDIYKLIILTLQHNTVKPSSNINNPTTEIILIHNKLGLTLEESLGKFISIKNILRKFLNNYLHIIPSLGESIELVNNIFDLIYLKIATLYSAEQKQTIINNFQKTAHHDRLSRLGQMTSTFVHDFKNPLTSIKGFVQLIESEYPNLQYLDIILSEIEQLNLQLSNFLLLSKNDDFQKEWQLFSINELIKNIVRFLYPSLLEANISLDKSFEKELYFTGCESEIRQVIINVIFNAIDVLTNLENKREIKIRAFSENNKHINISITNNGPVIPDKLISTMFNPFFTTKECGTGLGLFICKQIINNHNGTLTCNSDHSGTTMSIRLPK